MKISIYLLTVASAFAFSAPAMAQLEPYRDYTLSDSVSSVTTVRVAANMIDNYLEGIRGTWVASN